jgi:hypothetical protein
MLQGIQSESRRLGFKPAGWTRNQDARAEVGEVDECRLRFSYFARDETQLAQRKDIVDVIVGSVQSGLLKIDRARLMLDSLTAQWRREAQVRGTEDLKAALETARALNTQLKG